MIKFDPTISFGTLLTIGAILGAAISTWYGFKGYVEVKVTQLTATLESHAEKMGNYDRELTETRGELRQQREAHTLLIGQVQNLVGKMDMLLRRRMREGD